GNRAATAGPVLAAPHGMRSRAPPAGSRSRQGSLAIVAVHLSSVHGRLRYGRPDPSRGAAPKPRESGIAAAQPDTRMTSICGCWPAMAPKAIVIAGGACEGAAQLLSRLETALRAAARLLHDLVRVDRATQLGDAFDARTCGALGGNAGGCHRRADFVGFAP